MDEDLLQMFYQGNDQAFSRLHLRHDNRLRGLAWLMARGSPQAREWAAEAAQDAWLRVVRTRDDGLSRWNPALGPVRTWLDAVLRNALMDVLRRTRRTPGQAPEEDRPAPGGDPETLAIAHEQADLFADCLDALPERLRTLVSKRYLEGVSQTDIAQQIGRSDSWVSHQLARARDLLEACLQRKGVL